METLLNWPMTVQYKTRIIIVALAILAFSFCVKKASAENLPDMMMGQVTLQSGGQTHYYGMGGSYAILNNTATDRYGLDSNLLARDGGCQGKSITSLVCYSFGSYSKNDEGYLIPFVPTGGRLFLGRTKITDMFGTTRVVSETPALYYGNNVVSGDTSVGNSLDNFAFWGRNLAQSGGSVEADGVSWKLEDYSVNSESQSAWNDESSSEFGQYNSKLKAMAQNATTIPASVLQSAATTLCLQNSGISNTLTDCSVVSDLAKYPEGRVWIINSSVTIQANARIEYRGVGTIIIRGNLIVGDGAKIIPRDPKNDKLGIIVLDN